MLELFVAFAGAVTTKNLLPELFVASAGAAVGIFG